MKAIILNAGKGSRLAPFTDTNHKCLIKVCDKRIIDYQLDALKSVGIYDVVIVVGHLKDKIIEYLSQYSDFNFIYIENPDYSTTNTAYSLRLAKSEMLEDFIYMNGDVIFPEEMISRLVQSKYENSLAVEIKSCGAEEVKIILDNGRITQIGKDVPLEFSYGEFIGIAKFSKNIAGKFIESLDNVIEIEHKNKEYFEYALQQIIDDVVLTSVDISDLKTIEIDFPEDLQKAEEIFRNAGTDCE
jgi:choline kinase